MSTSDYDLDADIVGDALKRLWDAYHLAERRLAQYATPEEIAERLLTRYDSDDFWADAAWFHHNLLEHLAFGNEGGVVQVLHNDDDGIVVHVTLWEDDE